MCNHFFLQPVTAPGEGKGGRFSRRNQSPPEREAGGSCEFQRGNDAGAVPAVFQQHPSPRGKPHPSGSTRVAEAAAGA